MPVKQRLIRFAKSKERSVRAFEIKCSLGIGYINAIRISISPEKLKSIVSHYPDLNTGWLLTGIGDMVVEQDKGVKMVQQFLKEPAMEYQQEFKNHSEKMNDSIVEKLLKYIDHLHADIEKLDEEKEKLLQEIKMLQRLKK